jgi:hypothetical protein
MSQDNNNLGTIAKDARVHVLVTRAPSPDSVETAISPRIN